MHNFEEISESTHAEQEKITLSLTKAGSGILCVTFQTILSFKSNYHTKYRLAMDQTPHCPFTQTNCYCNNMFIPSSIKVWNSLGGNHCTNPESPVLQGCTKTLSVIY